MQEKEIQRHALRSTPSVSNGTSRPVRRLRRGRLDAGIQSLSIGSCKLAHEISAISGLFFAVVHSFQGLILVKYFNFTSKRALLTHWSLAVSPSPCMSCNSVHSISKITAWSSLTLPHLSMQKWNRMILQLKTRDGGRMTLTWVYI